MKPNHKKGDCHKSKTIFVFLNYAVNKTPNGLSESFHILIIAIDYVYSTHKANF